MSVLKKNLYILVVDDEHELLETLKPALEDLDAVILTAPNGAAAMELIATHGSRIVLVLSDFQMPEMNGFELRRAMLENWRDIPFVVLSAHVSREEALQAVELKISAFLAKPCSFDDLKKCVLAESKDRTATIKEEDELLTGFITESRGNLELLDPLVFELEARPQDLDLMNRIFGLVHTLKGASGFFQPLTLHHFVHKFEDVLSQIKNGSRSVDANVISMILKATSVLSTLLDELESGQHQSELEKLLEILVVSSSPNTEVTATPAAMKPQANSDDGNRSLEHKKDLRVSVEVLDEFMQVSGEMTVIRNMIDKAVRSLEKSYPGNKEVQLLSSLL